MLQIKIENISNDETTLRIRDQEKISFISELELKTKRLLESESGLNLLKNEFNQLDKQYRTIKENYDEVNLKKVKGKCCKSCPYTCEKEDDCEGEGYAGNYENDSYAGYY